MQAAALPAEYRPMPYPAARPLQGTLCLFAPLAGPLHGRSLEVQSIEVSGRLFLYGCIVFNVYRILQYDIAHPLFLPHSPDSAKVYIYIIPQKFTNFKRILEYNKNKDKKFFRVFLSIFNKNHKFSIYPLKFTCGLWYYLSWGNGLSEVRVRK
ncbi:MAG: hypothetical protein NC078_02045 [Ruminococcus sp.]|nr:hypothetical protein [Ruminococcus sp.]